MDTYVIEHYHKTIIQIVIINAIHWKKNIYDLLVMGS